MRLLFALLLCGISCAQIALQSWSVRYTTPSNFIVVGPQGQSQFPVASSSTNNLFSSYSGQAQWYYPTLDITTSALNGGSVPSYIPSFSNILQVTPRVEQALLINYAPFSMFYGGPSTSPFQCTPAYFEGFTCTTVADNLTVAIFAAMGTEDILNPTSNPPQLPVNFNLNTAHPLAATLFTDMLSLAFFRAETLTQYYNSLLTISQMNTNRSNGALSWSSGIVACIAAATLAIFMAVSVMQSWLVPVLSRPEASFAFWCVVFLAVQQVVSLAGGFPGWMAAYIVYSFYFIVLVVTYFVYRYFREKFFSPSTSGFGRPISNGRMYAVSEVKGRALDNRMFRRENWDQKPNSLGVHQIIIVSVASALLLLSLLACLLSFYVWTPSTYSVWNRVNSTILAEQTPTLQSSATLLLYSIPGLASFFNANVYARQVTTYCGNTYSQVLTTNQVTSAIIVNFVQAYNVDMSPYNPSDATQYSTVNAWLARTFAINARPISSAQVSTVAVCPSEGRVIVMSDVSLESQVWVKGTGINLQTLMGLSSDEASYYNGASVMIVRLAPGDYHRLNAPVNGRLTSWRNMGNVVLDTSSDAVRSQNNVLYNQRAVSFLVSPVFGRVGYVAVGATCIGSVVTTSNTDEILLKGSDMGYFQFGGSTIVVVFPSGSIQFDYDLLLASRSGVETFVRFGAKIGNH